MLIPNKFNGYSADGIRLYRCDDGASGSAMPTQQTVSQLSYSPEVQPIVSGILGGAAALAQQPYQSYQYNRIARFDPMQLQAQQAAANMRVSPYIGQAASLAGGAGERAGQFSYNPTEFFPGSVRTGQFTDPGTAGMYMSPYMQNVVDIQKREAQRQADIARTQRGAQAVGAGAFGGSRQAIMEAEAQRNLAQQMGDIQARGGQTAFEQAAQQYQMDQQRAMQVALANQAKNLEAQQLREQSRQFGADVGVRNLQQQLSAAQQLGGLGGMQFGQARDVIAMQAASGAERQALGQQKLTQDYEDFLRQKQYPYQQTQFLMEMARGMPMTSTQQIYAAPPSMASQIAGYGAGLYGLSRLGKKEGGLMKLALDKMEA